MKNLCDKYVAPDGAIICYLIVFYKHFTPIGVRNLSLQNILKEKLNG